MIAWRWPDSPVRYELVRTTVDAIPVPGKDPVTSQVVGRVVEHRRVSGDGVEPVRVRVMWDAIRFDQEDTLNEPLRYDSSKEHHWVRTRHPVIGSVASSLKTSLILEMGVTGALSGVGELEGYLRGIEGNLTEWGLAGERTYEQLQTVYTEEALLASSRGTYRFLPEQPVAVGESYRIRRPFTLQYVRTIESDETHTLESIDVAEDGSRIARFVVAGSLGWPDPGGMAGQAFNVSLDKAVVTGWWSYNLDAGLVTDYRYEASFLSDIVRFDPRDGSSTEMSTDQKIIDTLKLLPAEPGPEVSGSPAESSAGSVPSDP